MAKSKLHEFLLKEDVGTKPTNKPLSAYMAKKVGTKVIPKKTLVAKLSEDQVKDQCVTYLKSRGWESITIYTGGIPIGGGRYAENPAKGIPDTIAKKVPKKVWIEYKKSHGGIVSPEQAWWHTWLRACGDTVLVVNSLEVLKEGMNEAFGENY